MASQTGERTEKPTPKRRREARERGQVARSRDLSGALSLIAVAMALGWFGVRMIAAVRDRLVSTFAVLSDQAHVTLDAGALSAALWSDLHLVARLAGPPALVAAGASIAASVAQVGFGYAPKALKLNWGAINPANGIRRLAPKQSVPELAKAMLGLSAIGALCYVLVKDFYVRAPMLMAMMPVESGSYAWDLGLRLLWQSGLVLVVLASADYGVQRWQWLSSLKMTRQEVKDEQKLQDGNPEIKARVRRVQREMARRRMLHAVKTATVVVTNPTHFAVALEYRRDRMAAPIVVAKGQDAVAARIRAVAREHGVPIVENVPLARALYKTADIGDAIPADLFGAVAEVLAYLVRLKQLTL
ncbi:MAG: flagellar biosynthesis protein FlhB [Acidobacteria bacterium]|nr:flagellar biosynthesis protein FlhB [Acidobacteriota bacterium]